MQAYQPLKCKTSIFAPGRINIRVGRDIIVIMSGVGIVPLVADLLDDVGVEGCCIGEFGAGVYVELGSWS